MRFAISDLCFGFDTPALAIRQGRRIQSLRAFRRAMERSHRTLSGINRDVGRRSMTDIDMRELEIRWV